MNDATTAPAKAAGLEATAARFPDDLREALAMAAKHKAALPRTSTPGLEPTPFHQAPRAWLTTRPGEYASVTRRRPLPGLFPPAWTGCMRPAALAAIRDAPLPRGAAAARGPWLRARRR